MSRHVLTCSAGKQMKGTTSIQKVSSTGKEGKIDPNFVKGGLCLHKSGNLTREPRNRPDVFEKLRRWSSFAEFFSLRFRLFPLTPIIYAWDGSSNIILDSLLLVIYGSTLNGNIEILHAPFLTGSSLFQAFNAMLKLRAKTKIKKARRLSFCAQLTKRLEEA